MSLVAIGGLIGAVLLVRAFFKWGDDVHGWASEWRRYRNWSKRRSRRSSPYLWAVVAAVSVYLLFAFGSARTVAWVGTITASQLVWGTVRALLIMWPLTLLVAGALALVHHHHRRAKYMAGEPNDPRGIARAALRTLVAQAVFESLPALKNSREGQVPEVGKVEYVATEIGGHRFEYGMRVRLHMKRGFTLKGLRSHTSDGMAPEQDALATYVNSHLQELFGHKTTEARQVAAYQGRVPVFPFTALSYVFTTRKQVDPSQCDLLLMHRNPLMETFRYPAVRPQVSSLATPLLVGADISGRPVHMKLRERMTGVFGQSASGKSFYVLNLMIGASQCPNVAYVIIDMKGSSGDLASSMGARAAAVATDHESASITLDWLVREMDRRSNLAGQVGKLTKFSRDLPEIVVWLDEWHEFAYPKPDKDAATKRIQDLERLVRRARAFGIYLVCSTQIVHAVNVPTSITGQFHNVASTRLGKLEHSNMVFGGELPRGVGPHLIPPDWRGVAYGRFDGPVIDMMRSLLSGPEVAKRWAERDAKKGLNTPLPALMDALQPLRVRHLVSVASTPAEAPTSPQEPCQAVPVEVMEAADYLSGLLACETSSPLTDKQLAGLHRSAGNLARRKGITDEQRAEIAAHREVLRSHIHPDT